MNRVFAALLVIASLGACVPSAELLTGVRMGQEDRKYFSTPSLENLESRLIPWTTLAGYMEATGVGRTFAYQVLTGDQDRSIFHRPIGVVARDGVVHVADQTTGTLWRFRWQIEGHDDPDHIVKEHAGLTHPSLEQVTAMTAVREVSDVYVSRVGEIFVADAAGGKVVRYDAKGDLLQVYEHADFLNRPVAVTVDRRNVRLFVADSFFDYILVFNMDGTPLYKIGDRGDEPGRFRNIRDMVQGRAGIYVLDGLNRRIQAFGLDGTFITKFGDRDFNEGAGIAVDDKGWTYVSDRFEHQIVLFKDGEFQQAYGKRGTGPGEFNAPTNLWLADGYLYVADTNNSRVQVLRIIEQGDAGSVSSRLVPDHRIALNESRL